MQMSFRWMLLAWMQQACYSELLNHGHYGLCCWVLYPPYEVPSVGSSDLMVHHRIVRIPGKIPRRGAEHHLNRVLPDIASQSSLVMDAEPLMRAPRSREPWRRPRHMEDFVRGRVTMPVVSSVVKFGLFIEIASKSWLKVWSPYYQSSWNSTI